MAIENFMNFQRQKSMLNHPQNISKMNRMTMSMKCLRLRKGVRNFLITYPKMSLAEKRFSQDLLDSVKVIKSEKVYDLEQK